MNRLHPGEQPATQVNSEPAGRPGLLRTIRTWGEMVKFSHSIFALPFALVATVIAGQYVRPTGPSWLQIALIVGCMVAARSFAMTFNRIADRAIDGRNPRTAARPLITGAIHLRQAWTFAVVAAAAFACLCGLFWVAAGNPWPLLLSPIVLAYLAGYSYAKRFTWLSHFWLGFAIATAPVAAWIAVDPASLGPAAFILMGAAGLWIAGFDIIYACQDADFDRREGLHSLPARIGVGPALWVSRACHLVTIGLLLALPRFEPLGNIYHAGVAIAALLLVVEQSMVRAGDLSRVNLAFFTVNGVVSLVFAAASIADVWWGRRV